MRNVVVCFQNVENDDEEDDDDDDDIFGVTGVVPLQGEREGVRTVREFLLDKATTAKV